jgi:two-component system sensor histidine kinase KdpD
MLRRLEPWIAWGGVLVLVTLVLATHRDVIGQHHVALIYLLVVLGGSVGGGRWLGWSLSFAGFFLIDYYFQSPIGRFEISKPIDWTALLAFLATSAVTAHLLTQALEQANAARRAAQEVARLSRIGSQALQAGRATDALARIATVIRSTLEIHDCEIFRWTDGGAELAAAAGTAPPMAATEQALVASVAADGRTAAIRGDGMILRGPSSDTDALGVRTDDVHVVLLPLRVDSRTVGVLRIADDHPMELDADRHRFLVALAYYAALGVERVRLVAQADRAEALREANRLKDIVLASVSHDLRTPLTAIKALAHQSARQGDENARMVEQQVDRLEQLVSDLLDLSRLKGGVFPVTLEPNTAEDLVGAAARQFTGRGADRIQTAVDMTRSTLVGRFDFVQSLRILTNLIENALRYAPDDSRVDVAMARQGEALVFTVADRGPGIPPAERERVFEPFYRAAHAPPDTGRVGLGLSIARRLAEAQGGRLRYEDRPGGGSVFVLELHALDLPALDTGDWMVASDLG